MTHTYICNLVHVVFSTKERRQLIKDALRPDLWAYMGGIARRNGFKAIAIGGIDDHVHLLLSLPATMPIAKAVQLIKGGSSHWVRESRLPSFEWQENYAAFSVSMSQSQRTIDYINTQEQHHKNRGFDEELAALLAKHGIEAKNVSSAVPPALADRANA
jgi:putative transposase